MVKTSTLQSKSRKKNAAPTPSSARALTRSAAQKSPLPDHQRQPQRCTKCPGRPLRTQCIHTKRGKAYVLRQGAMQSLRDNSPQAEQPQQADSSSALSAALDPFDSVSVVRQNRNRLFATPRASASGADHSTPDSPCPQPQKVSVLTTADLAHLSLRSSKSVSSSSRSSVSAPPNRTSARNPYHGFVEGAYRGTEVYQIVRGHGLPSPIANNTRAIKKFTTAMNSIVEKCEDISRETACWLFIGAQHSTARGGAISYASPRLRRDAAAQVGNIGTQFSSLTRNLIQARTQENAELQRQLDESRRQTQEMAAQLQEVTHTQKELDRELRRYKSRYNVD